MNLDLIQFQLLIKNTNMYIGNFISISDVFCPIYLDESVVDYTFLIKLSNNLLEC